MTTKPPTLLCAGLLAGTFAVGAATPEPLRVHVLSGSKEYQSEASLKAWIAGLRKEYRVEVTASWGTDKIERVEGIGNVPQADILVVFARRWNLPEGDMAVLRTHWESGKPVVGIRTASHAFQEEDNEHFDRKVLGNHYDGHYGKEEFDVVVTAAGKTHPVLEGVGPIRSRRLYKAKALAPDTAVLQTGDIGKGPHPVTLVHEYRGGRMIYTSLGIPADFIDPDFRRLLRNALFWAARRDEAALRRIRHP